MTEEFKFLDTKLFMLLIEGELKLINIHFKCKLLISLKNFRSILNYTFNMHLYHNFAEQSVDGTEDIWFINFYSPHCSHCHELAPTVSNLFTLVTIYN